MMMYVRGKRMGEGEQETHLEPSQIFTIELFCENS